MRRTASALFVLALVAAACGGGDGTTNDTTGDTTGPEPTTGSTAGTTTTTAATTTQADMSGPEAFIAASAANVGEYEGQWDNATFGSSGALYINVLEANTDAGFVLVQVDVDGFAFGAEDPELFVVEIFTNGDALAVGFTSFLGDDPVFEPDLDNGTFTMVAMPPLLGGMTLEIEGTMTPGGFSGTYVIPGLADGTWGVEPVG